MLALPRKCPEGESKQCISRTRCVRIDPDPQHVEFKPVHMSDNPLDRAGIERQRFSMETLVRLFQVYMQLGYNTTSAELSALHCESSYIPDTIPPLRVDKTFRSAHGARFSERILPLLETGIGLFLGNLPRPPSS